MINKTPHTIAESIFGAWETRRKHIQCGLFSVKCRWHLSFANISELLTGNANRQLYTYSKTAQNRLFRRERKAAPTCLCLFTPKSNTWIKTQFNTWPISTYGLLNILLHQTAYMKDGVWGRNIFGPFKTKGMGATTHILLHDTNPWVPKQNTSYFNNDRKTSKHRYDEHRNSFTINTNKILTCRKSNWFHSWGGRISHTPK
jgi:hypothetical protein